MLLQSLIGRQKWGLENIAASEANGKVAQDATDPEPSPQLGKKCSHHFEFYIQTLIALTPQHRVAYVMRHLLHLTLSHRNEQGLLVRKVLIKTPDADPCSFGNMVGAESLQPLALK